MHALQEALGAVPQNMMVSIQAHHPYAIAGILMVVVGTPCVAGRATYAPYLPDARRDRERLERVRAGAGQSLLARERWGVGAG